MNGHQCHTVCLEEKGGPHGVRFPCGCSGDECARLDARGADLDRAACSTGQCRQRRCPPFLRARPVLRLEFPQRRSGTDQYTAQPAVAHGCAVGRAAGAGRRSGRSRKPNAMPRSLNCASCAARQQRSNAQDEPDSSEPSLAGLFGIRFEALVPAQPTGARSPPGRQSAPGLVSSPWLVSSPPARTPPSTRPKRPARRLSAWS